MAAVRDRGRLLAIAAIVLLFALSVVARLSYLERPMGLHHEEGTARTLVHSAAWWEDGPTGAGFLLRTTLNSPGDKFLGGGGDEDGNSYYYSFPPGHPLWAFLAHRAIGLEPTVGSVRVFNLLLNLLCIAMIYLIVRELLSRLPADWSRFAGVCAAGVYLFAPVALWYQSNAYTSGSAVQPFFIAGILVFVYAYRHAEDGSSRVSKYAPLALALITFLMSYTEWLGLAFAAVVGVLALVRSGDRVARRLGVAAVAGGGLAIALVVLQYSVALGPGGVFDTLLGRYADRSGLVGGVGYTYWMFESWSRLGGIYVGALGVPALGLVGLYIWERTVGRGMPRRFSGGDAPAGLVLAVAGLPVLVHHLVLFDHTVVHDFDSLKTVVPLSLAFGLLVGRVIARQASRDKTALGTKMVAAGLLTLAVMAGSFAMFAHLNDHVYTEPVRLGELIAENSEPDEVVWIDSPSYVPTSITTHYSGRNFLLWKSNPDGAAAVLEKGGPRTGVYFLLDEYLGLQAVGYVGADGVIRETREEAKATLVE